MSSPGSRAELHLDGICVGVVIPHGESASWAYGEFTPAECFAKFAPLFGVWSVLMHAEDDQDRQSHAASDELRQAEVAIDRLDAKLFWPESSQWLKLLQVNIDGTLIEWKHDGPSIDQRRRAKPTG